jgi:hypothetical protein
MTRRLWAKLPASSLQARASAPQSSLRRSLVGVAIAATLVALAAMPAYFVLGPAWRTLAVRLVCAAAVVAGCVRAVRWAREAVAAPGPSLLHAPPPPAPGVELDARFLALRDDVRYSLRSRRYFDVILWPRLAELGGPGMKPPARRRRLRRRGPPVGELARLVSDIERRT